MGFRRRDALAGGDGACHDSVTRAIEVGIAKELAGITLVQILVAQDGDGGSQELEYLKLK